MRIINQIIFTQFSASNLKDLIREAVKESLVSQNDHALNGERTLLSYPMEVYDRWGNFVFVTETV